MIVKLLKRILSMTKNYKLAQEANKDVVYGALQGLIKNQHLWRSSPVGREYCHLTALSN